jgi:L-rhamnose mutarotase
MPRTMIRRAFTMRLKPGKFAEYKDHHDNIWPELVAEVERSGIASITTFRSGDNLFLFSEIHDQEAWDRLWNSEIHRKWAAVMEPLMHIKPDGIVDFGELDEIFHVETGASGKGGR